MPKTQEEWDELSRMISDLLINGPKPDPETEKEINDMIDTLYTYSSKNPANAPRRK